MKKILFSCAILTLTLACLPALADGGFTIHGAYWDTKDAEDTLGIGVNYIIPVGTVFGIELRASYYEELQHQPFRNLLDGDAVFEEGLEVLPLEIGARFDFSNAGAWNPYVSGGMSYFLLDSEMGDVDDEFGYYVTLGTIFGDRQGAHFFAEAIFRQVEGSVKFDPERLDDIDDIDFEDGFDVDLSGIGANVGVAWRW